MKKENFARATNLIDRHTRIESDLEKIAIIRNKANRVKEGGPGVLPLKIDADDCLLYIGSKLNISSVIIIDAIEYELRDELIRITKELEEI
jgi:hypothetical protein